PLERLPEKLLDLSAGQTNDVRVFLLAPRLVIMLLARLVHQVELIDQAAFFQQFQRAIDRDAIEFRILLARHLVETFGIEVLTSFVDEVEQDLTLTGEA